jgi:hypothetical protein
MDSRVDSLCGLDIPFLLSSTTLPCYCQIGSRLESEAEVVHTRCQEFVDPHFNDESASVSARCASQHSEGLGLSGVTGEM